MTDATLLEELDFAARTTRAGLEAQRLLERAAATIRAKDERIVRIEAAVAVYEKTPLDIYDRPTSWAALEALLDAARTQRGEGGSGGKG